MRRIETLKAGTDAIGNRVKVKVTKNKVGPPFAVCEFDFFYDTGVSREGELIDFGVQFEVMVKSGAFYSYNGAQLGQGKDNTRRYLREHPDVANEIELKVGAFLGGTAAAPEGFPAEP